MTDKRPPKPPANPANKPYPKLRTRQQITLKYKELEQARSYYQGQREYLTASTQASPMVLASLDRHIAECTAWLEALFYALNDRV